MRKIKIGRGFKGSSGYNSWYIFLCPLNLYPCTEENEESCGKTAEYLNVRSYFYHIRSLTPQQTICKNALAIRSSLLEKYGFLITEETVMEILKNPDRVVLTKKGRKIAQGRISETHVLRVIFEEIDDSIEVITFYPGRRKRYED